MKSFKKFCHIENSYQTEFIDKVKEVNGVDALYVMQEKVDGANFSFIVGRNESGIVEVSCGKRSGELDANEYFEGWQVLCARCQESIINLFEILEKKYDCSEGANIFGEICGGVYGNLKSTESKILGRIHYSPRHEFYGFDIFIPTVGYLPPLDCVELFNEANVFCAENLFVGTLDECLAHDPVFLSTIGTRLGYEPIEGNNAEGYVIKPVIPSYFGNGERIIIKLKNPKYREVQHERKIPKEVVLSDALTNLCESVEDYVNENRLVSVLSHLGDVTFPKDFGKVMKEFSADVYQEFIDENSENKTIYTSLSKDEQKRFTCHVGRICGNLIKSKYMS
jgi:Rnl2 family RNA ligase